MNERNEGIRGAEYHLREVDIARDINDVHRIVPAIPGGARRILEVGCGAGAALSTCEMDGNRFLCGVDVDDSALKLGRELFKHVHFVEARGESLPFRSMEFDFVIARVSLPYMNIPLALSEIARVLKPGGTVWAVLHPFSMVKQEFLTSVRRLNLRDCVFRAYVMLNGFSMHLTGAIFPFRPGRYESFQTNHSITNALLTAGLTEIDISRGQFFIASGRTPWRYSLERTSEKCQLSAVRNVLHN